MSELGSIPETWIDIEDALLIVVHWVDPHMSAGAANVFLKEARQSKMVRSGLRIVSASEERRAGDIQYITTVAPGRHEFRPFREFVVKEDLDYYCALKLGSRQKDGVALCGGVSAEHAPEHVEQPSLREPPRLIQLPKEEPKGARSSAAWKAMNALWPGRSVPEIEKTSDVHRAVNKWIKKQPRSLVEVDEVSREVVERLLGRRK
jgi:hypothetical protein